jgi:predicted 3-demethylubiquinone-9 3-methyltransferase (glyoxalase superfamily)
MPKKVRTCLWFDGNAEEAAEFYVSLIPDSQIDSYFRTDSNGPPLVVEFTLGGTSYMGLNGGPTFKLSEAASIVVSTRDQKETDELWNKLTADGGSESACGWLRDRYGLSWQIVPEALPRLLKDSDREAAGRAMQAMMQMQKINVAALEAAFQNA